MWSERSDMQDDPLSLAIRITTQSNTPTGKFIRELIRNECPNMSSLIENVHTAIADSDSSRCRVYKDINPNFLVHDIYKTKHIIHEFHRISFTRFRVSGHSLAVETGRWNRRGRGRLPLEERLGVCGDVQTDM